MHTVEPQPWPLGVRLRRQPSGVHRMTVASGAPADGATIGDVIALADGVWVSVVIRDGGLIPVRVQTRLQAADHLLILADPDLPAELADTFSQPGRGEHR